MTKEEIIAMAKKAGWDDHHCQFDTRIKHFAELVADAEAKRIYEQGMVTVGHMREQITLAIKNAPDYKMGYADGTATEQERLKWDIHSCGPTCKRYACVATREAVQAEREAIYDEWHSCVMSDLENGVKCLNEKASKEWHEKYPAQSKMFPSWIEERSNT